MNDRQPLKERLPFPYNQDLKHVVRRLDRRTRDSREKLANDPVTAAYLAAGMRLVERHLGPDARRTPVDQDDETSLERPLLSFLSQRAVAAEVANNPVPFPRAGNVSTMRSTWRSHSDFIADLLSFGLWSYSRPAYWENSQITAAADQLKEGSGFSRSVHLLAYANMVLFVTQSRFRLELVAAAAADGDEVIREAMVEHYRGALGPWKQLLTEVLEARKMRLRPGITPDDFVNLLTAVAEGTALRELADPTAGIVDHANGRCLLGTAALTLISACMQPADGTEGTPIEQVVDDMMTGGF